MIVILDIVLEPLFEMRHILKFPEIKEFGLGYSEEALDGHVVETVALSGHTLGDTVFA